MKDVSTLQKQLIAKALRFHPLSEEVIRAFYQQPRHEFVPPSYSLTEAYEDRPLELFRQKTQHSTISQPSFVLYLLELLQLKPGHKVFEVGAGSAWNAALMAELVGANGKVLSMEIIPEIARSAQQKVQQRQLPQVQILEGDAAEGWAAEAPYDRIIFTAAAPQPPEFLRRQLREGGRALFVQKGPAETDELQVLEKRQGELQCLKRVPCHFVTMTGSAKAAPSTSP